MSELWSGPALLPTPPVRHTAGVRTRVLARHKRKPCTKCRAPGQNRCSQRDRRGFNGSMPCATGGHAPSVGEGLGFLATGEGRPPSRGLAVRLPVKPTVIAIGPAVSALAAMVGMDPSLGPCSPAGSTADDSFKRKRSLGSAVSERASSVQTGLPREHEQAPRQPGALLLCTRTDWRDVVGTTEFGFVLYWSRYKMERGRKFQKLPLPGYILLRSVHYYKCTCSLL